MRALEALRSLPARITRVLWATLTRGALPCLAIFSFRATAVDYIVNSTTVVQHSDQPLGITGVDYSKSTSSVEQSLGIEANKILPNLSLSNVVHVDRVDYSSTLLYDLRQVPRSLSVVPQNLVNDDVSLSWAKGEHGARIKFNSTLSESYYSSQGLNFAYSEGLYDKSTVFSLEAGYFENKNPLDYFIDRDFRIKARPTLVHGNDVALVYEQIFSERWKSRFKVSTHKMLELRPRSVGVELLQAYALSDRVFAKASVAYFSDLHGERLQDERGYFSAGLGQLELSLEPLYDFIVSASYGVSIEREAQPAGKLTQVGTDQYGLGLSYLYHSLTLELRGNLSKTNTKTSFAQLSGGVTWTL